MRNKLLISIALLFFFSVGLFSIVNNVEATKPLPPKSTQTTTQPITQTPAPVQSQTTKFSISDIIKKLKTKSSNEKKLTSDEFKNIVNKLKTIKEPMLVNTQHTESKCESAGGEVIKANTATICRFTIDPPKADASCPDGWAKFETYPQNKWTPILWTATESDSQSYQYAGGNYSLGMCYSPTTETCRLEGYDWSNKKPEAKTCKGAAKVCIKRKWFRCSNTITCSGGADVTVKQKIKQIGCY